VSSEYDIALEQTAAPQPEASDGELIADLLAEHGVEPLPTLVLAVEHLAMRLAYKMAAEALRHWLLSLPRTSAAAAALRRVILNSRDESLRESGRHCGVSHVAILKAEKRLERALRLPAEATCRNNVIRRDSKKDSSR
jgi:hypothetical protein